MHIMDAEKECEYSLKSGYGWLLIQASVVKWGRLMTLKDMLFRFVFLLHVRDKKDLTNIELGLCLLCINFNIIYNKCAKHVTK